MLTDPDGAVYAPGAFVLALGALRADDKVVEAFRTGAGIGWHEHDDDVFVGCEQFFRPGYVANLVTDLAPGSRRGRREARAPARRSPTSAVASARRRSCLPRPTRTAQLVGCDYHEGSIELARKRAADAGVARADLLRGRVGPEVPGQPATTSSPRSTACTTWATRSARPRTSGRRWRRTARWLIVEPAAGNTVSDNLNPVGRVYYNFSTFLCVPNALSQPGGCSLGAGRRGGDRDARGARPGSPGSAGPRRRRSTSSTKPGPDSGCASCGRESEAVRAREPDRAATPCGRRAAVLRGLRVGPTTVLLLPAWAIVHSRMWKLQVPYLARHFRVITYDPRGNGRSDRPRSRRRTPTPNSSPTPSPCWMPPAPRARSASGCRWAARCCCGSPPPIPTGSRARSSSRRRCALDGQPLPACWVQPFEAECDVPSGGASTTPLLAARPAPISRASSSARSSRSRTRPSRSTTPSTGRSTSTPRR